MAKKLIKPKNVTFTLKPVIVFRRKERKDDKHKNKPEGSVRSAGQAPAGGEAPGTS